MQKTNLTTLLILEADSLYFGHAKVFLAILEMSEQICCLHGCLATDKMELYTSTRLRDILV